MSFNLVLSRAAINDIDLAMDWYEKQRKGLSIELELCIEAGLASLQRNPLLYQEKYKNVRVKYIKRFPYGIHYQIEASTIKVVAIFHMKQDPEKWHYRLYKKEL